VKNPELASSSLQEISPFIGLLDPTYPNFLINGENFHLSHHNVLALK